MLTLLEAKTELITGYTTSVNTDTGVLTITADNAGTAFTADATFTHSTSSVTSVYAEGSVNQVFDVDTIAFTDNNGATGNMAAGDSIAFTITDAAGNVTNINETFDTDFATTLGNIVTAIQAAGYSASLGGTTITVTGTAGKGEFTIAGFTFTDANAAGNVAAVIAQGDTDFVADADTLTMTEAVTMTAGDTITATVTNGVNTYTTAAVAFNTSYSQTMTDLATAIQGLNLGASFTAAFASGVITVTDAVTGGSPITAMSTTFADQSTSVTDVFAASTANVTGQGDVLIGGAGNDTLVAGTLSTLTGGEGKDTFDMRTVLSNVNSYATITDFLSGDVIKTTATSFDQGGVALASTAVFQDYANNAISTTVAGKATWFQFGSDTYVVDNNSGGTAFNAASDTIIKITGLVDLGSAASFNANQGTIELV